MADKKAKLVIIAGPTASGKTDIAIDLAQTFGGEIINADSMQVYREMDIGTAKPTLGERRGIPHHLLDVVDPPDPFNAALYRSLAVPLIKSIESRRKLCFVVGGTGLYIKTLLGGLFHCPPSDDHLREQLNEQVNQEGLMALYERLEAMDPEYAKRIHPNDKIRVLRALEIINLTQGRASRLLKEHNFKDHPFRSLKFCLQIDRGKLYHRINNRCLTMMEMGLLDEVTMLLEKGYSPNLKPMQSIGYRHMIDYIEGRRNLKEAVSKFQTDTRRYAKRQVTWFRSDPEMIWVDNNKSGKNEMVDKVREFL